VDGIIIKELHFNENRMLNPIYISTKKRTGTICCNNSRINTMVFSLKSNKLQMKVYTKTGDKGTTHFLEPEFQKITPIESYGTVDELNSHID
jgi:hypothetical protein